MAVDIDVTSKDKAELQRYSCPPSKSDEIEEIASITYHRMDALMEDGMIEAALQNEAWELAEVLIRLLETGYIPSEKAQKYARGIMDFAMAMYLCKIVDFPVENENGRYRYCNDIIKIWLAGKDILENV